MEFTKFFSVMVKHHGVPQLSQQATQRMYNIMFLEAKVSGLEEAKKIVGDHRFDIRIFELKKQLKDLTLGKSPDKFIYTLREDNI